MFEHFFHWDNHIEICHICSNLVIKLAIPHHLWKRPQCQENISLCTLTEFLGACALRSGPILLEPQLALSFRDVPDKSPHSNLRILLILWSDIPNPTVWFWVKRFGCSQQLHISTCSYISASSIFLFMHATSFFHPLNPHSNNVCTRNNMSL